MVFLKKTQQKAIISTVYYQNAHFDFIFLVLLHFVVSLSKLL